MTRSRAPSTGRSPLLEAAPGIPSAGSTGRPGVETPTVLSANRSGRHCSRHERGDRDARECRASRSGTCRPDRARRWLGRARTRRERRQCDALWQSRAGVGKAVRIATRPFARDRRHVGSRVHAVESRRASLAGTSRRSPAAADSSVGQGQNADKTVGARDGARPGPYARRMRERRARTSAVEPARGAAPVGGSRIRLRLAGERPDT
jgi:hypothetical protein